MFLDFPDDLSVRRKAGNALMSKAAVVGWGVAWRIML
jgi:hypothetical protein